MSNPKAVGENSEAAVLGALLQAGLTVLKPFGDNQRYDLAVDDGGGRVSRIQCKTARLKNDGSFLVFDTCSSYVHRGKGKRHYRGDADVFAAYSPDLRQVYIVPVDDAGTSNCSLRLRPSANGQQKNVRLANLYEIHSWVAKR